MLEGIIRESIKKQDTKRYRRDGYLIANIYGKGAKNINCAFNKNEFIKAVKIKENLAFNVKVGDNECKVVIQEYQKDPVTSDLLHVDLMLAQDGIKTKFKIPVKTVGKAKAFKNSGLALFNKKRIAVECTPENLPNYFTIDITDLDTGDSVLVRDLEVPANVKILDADRIAVISMVKVK
jgi:large subunit ribosomal protein L25